MARGPRLNPLNTSHLDSLNELLQGLPPVLELAKACKDCGLPTDEYISQIEALQEQARQLKATFFPESP